MLSETCPSINSLGCGRDRGAAMRVPMIEMRACEGKRWRLRLLPVRRSRIPMSYSTPWAWKLQAVGSRLRAPVFRFPNVCPWEVGSWTPAPSDCCCRSKCPETDSDSSRSYGLIAPAKLVGPFNCQRILLLNASRFRSLLASSLHKTPGRPFSRLMSKQSTLFALHGRFEKLVHGSSKS
jgi:hypothetical protein